MNDVRIMFGSGTTFYVATVHGMSAVIAAERNNVLTKLYYAKDFAEGRIVLNVPDIVIAKQELTVDRDILIHTPYLSHDIKTTLEWINAARHSVQDAVPFAESYHDLISRIGSIAMLYVSRMKYLLTKDTKYTDVGIVMRELALTGTTTHQDEALRHFTSGEHLVDTHSANSPVVGECYDAIIKYLESNYTLTRDK